MSHTIMRGGHIYDTLLKKVVVEDGKRNKRISTMKKEVTFTQGEKVNYIGRGFIGFRTNDREAEFNRYEGMSDAYIKYDGYNVLVRRSEIEAIKKPRK